MSPLENLPDGLAEIAREASRRKLAETVDAAFAPPGPNLTTEEKAQVILQRGKYVTEAMEQTSSLTPELVHDLENLRSNVIRVKDYLISQGATVEEIDSAAIAAITAAFSPPPSPEIAPSEIKPNKQLSALRKRGIFVEGEDYTGQGNGIRYTASAIEKLNQLQEEMNKTGNKKITQKIIDQVFPPPDNQT